MGTRRGRTGYTLVELLVVLGVGTLMLTGVVTAIFQTLAIPVASSLKISALENIKSSARWLIQDVRMAGASNLTDGGPAQNALTLTWNTYFDANGQFDPLNPIPHSSSYAISGTDLRRTYDGNVSTAGRDISSVQFSLQGDIITATITALPRGRTGAAERRTYEMYLEPKTDPVR